MFPVSRKSKGLLLVSGASLAGKPGKGQGRRVAVSNSRRRSHERIERHKDASTKARGYVINDVLPGYREWFRQDGSRMRSGYFQNGEWAGEWTTYDDGGKLKMKSRS